MSKLFRNYSWLVAALAVGCGSVPPRPPVPTHPPPAAPAARAVAILVHTPTGGPVAGAACQLHISRGWSEVATANADGYVLWPTIEASLRATDVQCAAAQYEPFLQHRDLHTGDNEDLDPAVVMTPLLPPAPTRAEILQVRLTFQGLTVQTQQYGTLPWFEAALPWMTAADRQAAYNAKHASPAWPGGDTHAIISLPSGPPLYDEAGQPYSADRFGPLDWTNGGTKVDGRLADLVVELARAGFNKQLLFLGGDDGARGFPIAMAQLDLVADALRQSAYGDLRGFVVLLPGWDGVFYGYSPDQVAQWGAKCRSLFVYCGLEHQPGRIPVGEGGGDYQPGGRMATFDLVLAEFDGPEDSAWRRTVTSVDDQGRRGYHGSQIWQIASRMLGFAYRRPDDQPADADGYSGPSYLAPGTPRGPYVHCAFEWVGEYLWVRGQESPADVARDRAYFQSLGYTCGG